VVGITLEQAMDALKEPITHSTIVEQSMLVLFMVQQW
jgi:hypothetical protein